MVLSAFAILSALLTLVSSSSIHPHEAQQEQPVRLQDTTRTDSVIDHPYGGEPLDHIAFKQSRADLRRAPILEEDAAYLEARQTKGCTTTVKGYTGYPCQWDGTLTSYSSTATAYTGINCNGCDHLYVTDDYYYCPNQRISATRTASTPYTTWSTVCQTLTVKGKHVQLTTPTLAASLEDELPAAVPPTAPLPLVTTPPKFTTMTREKVKVVESLNMGAGNNLQLRQHTPPCPTTYVVQPEQTAGRTRTTYSQYVTTTVILNCNGCSLILSTALAGPGQVGHFTKTTTLPVGTKTAFACP